VVNASTVLRGFNFNCSGFDCRFLSGRVAGRTDCAFAFTAVVDGRQFKFGLEGFLEVTRFVTEGTRFVTP
jgi:hypothetical protein